MTLLFFDKTDNLQFIRDDATEAKYCVEDMTHTAKFPEDSEKPFERGMHVGWIDDFGNFQYFEIRNVTRQQPDNTVAYSAEHVVISELTDIIVEDTRAYNTTAASAVTSVLNGTGWELGGVGYNPSTKGTNFYFVSAWEAVLKIQKTWGVCLTPRLTISQNQIVHRYLDISDRRGAYRGLRLTLDRNVSAAGIEYNDADLKTALIGRGRGEETEAGGFGRRITFEDVSWSIYDGKPVNKPLGQNYVEIPEMTAIFGRDGQPRMGVIEFAQIDDPEELLQATYDKLVSIAKVDVTIKLTVASLRKLGYTNEGLQYGDMVDVIIEPWGLAQQANVVGLTYDLIYPENTKPTIGEYNTGTIVARTVRNSSGAEIADKIADNNSGLLDGYIDTARTRIMSSGTDRNTLADGSEIYVASDGTSAVLFTGAGILLSDEKDPNGDWIWRTAIDGNGIIADEITAGVLQANLIRILGTTNFYWDAGNIYIVDPSDSNRQIRIGQYDGQSYGIGFTRDGGYTWQTAMDFNGLNVQATGFSKTYLSITEPVGSFNIGDMWIKTKRSYTWDDACEAFTWATVSEYLWKDLFGPQEPNMYTWNGTAWQKTYDGESISAFQTQLIVMQNQIELAVQSVATKGSTFIRYDDPVYDPAVVVSIGDHWIRRFVQNWNEAKEQTWNAIGTQMWQNMLGNTEYAWDGYEWIVVSDRGAEVYHSAKIINTDREIKIIADSQATMNEQVVRNTAELSVQSNRITSTVELVNGNTIALNSKIEQTAARISAEVANKYDQKSGIYIEASGIRLNADRYLDIASGNAIRIGTGSSKELLGDKLDTIEGKADDIADGTTAVPHVESSGLTIQNGNVTIGGTTQVTVNANKKLQFGCAASDSAMVIDNNGVSIGSARNISIQAAGSFSVGASGSGVQITNAGIHIDTGGYLQVDAENLSIDQNGKLTATDAYLSGTLQRNGYDVLTRQNIVVQTQEPSTDMEVGTVWIKPTGGISAMVTHEFEYPDDALRRSLKLHPYSGTLRGDATPDAGTTYKYTATAMVYLSAQVDNATVTLSLNNGAVVLTGHCSGRSQNVQVQFDEVTADTWIANSPTISFVLSSDTADVNNARSAGTSKMLVTVTSVSTTGSGARSWGSCEVKVLQ